MRDNCIAAGSFNQPQHGVRQQTGMVAGDDLQLQMQSRTENCCPFTANQTFVNGHTRFESQVKQKKRERTTIRAMISNRSLLLIRLFSHFGVTLGHRGLP